MLAAEAPNLMLIVVLPFSMLLLVCIIACALYVALGRLGPPHHR